MKKVFQQSEGFVSRVFGEYAGTWNSSTTYDPGNWLFRNGFRYICRKASTNHAPESNPYYWRLLGNSGVFTQSGAFARNAPPQEFFQHSQILHVGDDSLSAGYIRITDSDTDWSLISGVGIDNGQAYHMAWPVNGEPTTTYSGRWWDTTQLSSYVSAPNRTTGNETGGPDPMTYPNAILTAGGLPGSVSLFGRAERPPYITGDTNTHNIGNASFWFSNQVGYSSEEVWDPDDEIYYNPPVYDWYLTRGRFSINRGAKGWMATAAIVYAREFPRPRFPWFASDITDINYDSAIDVTQCRFHEVPLPTVDGSVEGENGRITFCIFDETVDDWETRTGYTVIGAP